MSNMPSNSPVMGSSSGPAGWLPVWIKAVTQPNEQTFINITETPDASSRTAFIWIFIAGTFSGIVQAISQTISTAMGLTPQIPGLEQYMPATTGDAGSAVTTLITGLCVSPLAGLLTIVFFAIWTAIIQWVAKLFGGTGSFDKMAYAFAAISVPVTLVTTVLNLFSIIPYVGLCTSAISIGLGIYGLVLNVMAVKGVNRFGYGAAAGSVLIPFFVLIFVCGCLVVGLLSVLGPAINDTFNQINQSLAP